MTCAREKQIGLILRQLESARSAAISTRQTYALEQNIRLMESLRSLTGFINWLANDLPRLQGDRLLELNELLPEWDGLIHDQLLGVERHKWPAFIRPMVDALVHEITSARREMVLLDIGSGAMEIERQVITRLLERRKVAPTTFIAIDESASAHSRARANLAELAGQVQIKETSLEQVIELAHQPAARFRVLLCRCNASALDALADGSLDLAFHSFMRHHLLPQQRIWLDQACARIAYRVLEYDGYRSTLHLMALALACWRHPAFLSAGIVSCLRFPKREQLLMRDLERLQFFSNGCYLGVC